MTGNTSQIDLYFVNHVSAWTSQKSKTVILDIDTGVSRESLQKIANILNDDLADEYVLLTRQEITIGM